jgi:hypothetical protein
MFTHKNTEQTHAPWQVTQSYEQMFDISSIADKWGVMSLKDSHVHTTIKKKQQAPLSCHERPYSSDVHAGIHWHDSCNDKRNHVILPDIQQRMAAVLNALLNSVILSDIYRSIPYFL